MKFLLENLNACELCIDKWFCLQPDKIAIIYGEKKFTYAKCFVKIMELANFLKINQIKIVTIFMPMSPEAVFMIMAVSRLGLIHNCVFGGFSSRNLKSRIESSKSDLVVTMDFFYRGSKKIEYSKIVDEAAEMIKGRRFKTLVFSYDSKWTERSDEAIEEIINEFQIDIFKNSKNGSIYKKHLENLEKIGSCVNKEPFEEENADIMEILDEDGKYAVCKFKNDCCTICRKSNGKNGSNRRHVFYWDEITHYEFYIKPVYVKTSHPLFYLYTSGSTGSPKGVIHSTGGYIEYAALSMANAFDIKPHDVFFSTADLGWITTLTYSTYGPLALGITSVFVDGLPFYPDVYKLHKIIEQHKVTHLYTSPTTIRYIRELLENRKNSLLSIETAQAMEKEKEVHNLGNKKDGLSCVSSNIQNVHTEKDINNVSEDRLSEIASLLNSGPDKDSKCSKDGFNYLYKGVFVTSKTIGDIFDVSSLRRIASVGESIDDSTMRYYRSIFQEKPFIDTYFQTETGGIVLATDIKVLKKTTGKPIPGLELEIGDDSVLLIKGEWGGKYIGMIHGDNIILSNKEQCTCSYCTINIHCRASRDVNENRLCSKKSSAKFHGLDNTSEPWSWLDSRVSFNMVKEENYELEDSYEAPMTILFMINLSIYIKTTYKDIIDRIMKEEGIIERVLLSNEFYKYISTVRSIRDIGKKTSFLVFLENAIKQNKNIDYQKIFSFIENKMDSSSLYSTGDVVVKDEDNNYTIKGRLDDVVNISGHRISTAEIESTATQIEEVVEAAAIEIPHEIKGQAMVLFCKMLDLRHLVHKELHGKEKDSVLSEKREEILKKVYDAIRRDIGNFAVPDTVIVSLDLPKTATGKIMRRVLRRLWRDSEDAGDISTCINPDCINEIAHQLSIHTNK